MIFTTVHTGDKLIHKTEKSTIWVGLCIQPLFFIDISKVDFKFKFVNNVQILLVINNYLLKWHMAKIRMYIKILNNKLLAYTLIVV